MVTGGGGFLGGAILTALASRGASHLASLGRSDRPALRKAGVETIVGDIADPDAVNRACASADIVFHCAANAGVWGAWQLFHRVNVLGTANIVDACSRRQAVLVHTSSPSAACGATNVEGEDESAVPPDQFLASYPKSKLQAERIVIDAAKAGKIMAVVVRPPLLYGPGDPHLLPRVLTMAQAGRLRVIGDGVNKVDLTYIDNAAHGHILAAERLLDGAPISGNVYYLSDGTPVSLWSWLDDFLRLVGMPGLPRRRIPFAAAYAAGGILEALHSALPFMGEPAITRFVAVQLSHPRWFDISAARRDLGYDPIVPPDDGLRLAAEHFKTSRLR